MHTYLKETAFVFFMLLLISCSKSEKEKNGPVPPNIIYILADDMGIGDIGAPE